jgi:sugar lactone lactonase YvrE
MRRVLVLQILALVLAPVSGAQELTFGHFAGSEGGRGYEDGLVSRARLASPSGVAVDAEGNTYIADAESHTIRRISVAGLVTTLAGLAGNAGSADGKGSSAQFNAPRGIAVDAAGVVYVADTGNHTIRKIAPGGVVSTLAGSAGQSGYTDGEGSAAGFWSPIALAIETSGNLLVADYVTGRIRRVTLQASVTTLKLPDGEPAFLSLPNGIAGDAAGNVYVAEGGQASVITRITPGGVLTTVAGLKWSPGSDDGAGSGARFRDPGGVVSDPAGNLWVADAGNGTVRSVTAEGVVTTIAGLALAPGCEDGAGPAARFNAPVAIARGADGTLAVADRANSAVRKVTLPGFVTTVAGGPRLSGGEDGQGAAARFNGPRGVAYDGLGNAFVADTGNSTIRKVTPQGAVSTLAGLAGVPGDEDGSGGSARFRRPAGIAVDADGNVFVTDETSHTIRKVTPDGIVTTVAGQALSPGSSDGTGNGARFHAPFGIASDAAGNLFVADRGNHTLRKVTPEGVVTTLAGQAGGSGSADGTGSEARFNEPRGVAVLGSGDIWVTDSLNYTIRRITSVGVVTTLAGSASRFGAIDGAGPAASFAFPAGIAATAAEEALVVDGSHGTIRRVTEAGIVTTAAGRAWTNGTAGTRVSVDGTGESVRLNDPWGIASGPGGTVLVTDASDHVIRLGERTLPDAATIDSPAGPVGVTRQLGAAPADATAWLWEPVRIEAGSTASLSSNTAPDPVFTPDTDGFYVFRLTASDGSFRRISTVALAAGTVFPTAVAYGRTDVCGGTPAAIRADLTGTPPWSLTWSDGVVQSGVPSSPAERYVTLAGLNPWSSPATYRVLAVSDAQGAGSSSGSSMVGIENIPRATVSGSGVVCDGRSRSIQASISSYGPVTLVWSDGLTEVVGESNHERIVSPSSVTTYSVTSVSNARCVGESSGSATVTPIPLPTAVVSGATTICSGQSAELQVDLTGMGPWRVVWSDGLVQNSVPESPYRRLVSPSTTSTYTVDAVSSVADSTCSSPGSGSATVTVVALPPPGVTITTPSPVAPGATGLVASVPGAGPGATYAWTITNGTITGGQGTSAVTYSVGGRGLCALTVTVTLPGGCPTRGSTSVWVGDSPTVPIYFSRLAGPAGGSGWFDGPGPQARFEFPTSIAADGSGNSYVLDRGSVRKVSPGGVVSTLAGIAEAIGSVDGQGATARFSISGAISATASGVLHVADSGNHTIRRLTPAGVVSTIAGESGTWGAADGAPGEARFRNPAGICVDSEGNVYVADTGNHTIRKVTPSGVVSTLAGLPGDWGSQDGEGTGARFRSPAGLAVDGAGNVYVADRSNHTIRKVSPAGVVTTLAGWPGASGSSNGTGGSARFNHPEAIALDGEGNLVVADRGNRTIRHVTGAGDVTTLAGLAPVSGGDDGTGPDARFAAPSGVAMTLSGDFLVADRDGWSIRKVTPGGVVTTVAGRASPWGTADGSSEEARFWWAHDVAVGGSGEAFVADTYNQTIRKVSEAGYVSTLAGQPLVWGSTDGAGSDARFSDPAGIALAASGNLYVSDEANCTIRRVSPTGVVTTLAGSYEGSRDGAGKLARFRGPWGITVDGGETVYVADSLNHTIRKITPSGIVTTFAGTAGYRGSDDGTGSEARFYEPAGVAVDRFGYVFVADRGNHTIRRITPAGVVTTLAGEPGRSGLEDGIGSDALFSYPTGIRLDGSGILYVADYGNGALRRVTPDGVVTTVGGGRIVAAADGSGMHARFGLPAGVAVGYSGEVVLTDTRHHVLWRGVPSLPDEATIDSTTGSLGQVRQLGVSPSTATSWRWEIVRTEAGSTAALSSTTIPTPTFTPDVPGYYRFRLTASDGEKKSVTLVSLYADLPAATAVVSGAATVCPGEWVTARVDLTGMPPWNVVWSSGETWNGLTFTPAYHSLRPEASTTLIVTSVSDAAGPGVAAGSAVFIVTPKTPTPGIEAPSRVGAGSAGRRASVPGNPGSAYGWWVNNGTINSGQGTREIVFTAGAAGTMTVNVRETMAGQCQSDVANASIEVVPIIAPTLLYPVTPCRVLDTRELSGPTGGQPVAEAATLVLHVGGHCGIPATARAVTGNVTVTQPSGAGQLVVFPGDEPKPVASTIHFAPGRTRASNSHLKLSTDDVGSLAIANDSSGHVHVILDVSGYYR